VLGIFSGILNVLLFDGFSWTPGGCCCRRDWIFFFYTFRDRLNVRLFPDSCHVWTLVAAGQKESRANSSMVQLATCKKVVAVS
jgi:hypothetical protein